MIVSVTIHLSKQAKMWEGKEECAILQAKYLFRFFRPPELFVLKIICL